MQQPPTLMARSHTRHLSIETRQHDLLGMDLGEGPERRTVVLTLVSIAVWDGALLLILGAGFGVWPTRNTLIVYTVPPLLLAWIGSKRSEANPRRRNLTLWALAIRQVMVGHRPIIGLGIRRPHRAELSPFTARGTLAAKIAAKLRPTAESVTDTVPAPVRIEAVSRPTRQRARARLYGNDETARRLTQRRRGQRSAS